MLITRRFGSWVVLGTLITEAELEPTPPLDADCGSCTLCIEACPTGALDEPGVLDATRCLSYWTQAGGPIPEEYRSELGDQVYGCDICQDVCPWNRGVEKRRAGQAPPEGAEPHVSLADWLEAVGDELARRYDRLFVPRNDPRYLRRNVLGAAVLLVLSRRDWPRRTQAALGACALAFDFAIVSAYILIYHFQQGSPIRQVIFVPLVEAALRYGIVGALALTVASAPVIAVFEWLRQRRFPPHTYHWNYVTLQVGIEALIALIVGWLVVRLRRQSDLAEARAGEAERLRDQLGQRADVLEAANRCARALN